VTDRGHNTTQDKYSLHWQAASLSSNTLNFKPTFEFPLSINQSIYLLTAAKKKKKEIPLLKQWKVRNKLTTYTIPAHCTTQTNWSMV